MLLLTTYEEMDTSTFAHTGQMIRRSQGQRLEDSLRLTRNTALFVGFSDEPGLARLCWRKPGSNRKWNGTRPAGAQVMYRFAKN
jgi:hypothetical protein